MNYNFAPEKTTLNRWTNIKIRWHDPDMAMIYGYGEYISPILSAVIYILDNKEQYPYRVKTNNHHIFGAKTPQECQEYLDSIYQLAMTNMAYELSRCENSNYIPPACLTPQFIPKRNTSGLADLPDKNEDTE